MQALILGVVAVAPAILVLMQLLLLPETAARDHHHPFQIHW
jgi:hypothetical protein